MKPTRITALPHASAVRRARGRVTAAGTCLTLAMLGNAALVQGAGTVQIKPGQWRVTSQVWLDGKEVLAATDAAGAEATAKALAAMRAGMTAAERAERRDAGPRQGRLRAAA